MWHLIHLACPQLNPYMEGSVSGANRGLFAMPRQLIGHISTPADLAGISSFAFQGTNAHALISPAASNGEAGTAVPAIMPVWQQQFISVVAPAHTQLAGASVAGAGAARHVAFAMRLGSQAMHAFFCDHQVTGKLIFPGMHLLPRSSACSLLVIKAFPPGLCHN